MNPEPDKRPDYWFPAKRRGWGWGLPAKREGWAVLLAFCALLAAGAALFLPRHETAAFVIYCAVLCLLLVLICWRTGEPPRWRWRSK